MAAACNCVRMHLECTHVWLMSCVANDEACLVLQGTESFCCEECLNTVVAAGVRVHFHAWESPNGTTDQRGQFPELYIRAM